MPNDQAKIQYALLSVSDKTGLVEFASQLVQHDIQILSTGGTAKTLQAAGINVIQVSDFTGYPEIMDGRVKTLHPRIHGGILGRVDQDHKVMQDQQIEPISLVVVNLYPFEQTIAKDDCDLTSAIEQIDIGGPAMVRAAAKNHQRVSIVVDPADYQQIAELLNEGEIPLANRQKLAAKAYAHTAAYDCAISQYLASQYDVEPTDNYVTGGRKLQSLRYGENPHQKAVFYQRGKHQAGTLAEAQLLQGKALLYNNIADADAALACVQHISDQPACVIVKHANPCGVAQAGDILTAYQDAFSTDPVSAFGGIIAFNRNVDEATAKAIISQQFLEVLIAPQIDEAAQNILSTKPNVRVIQTGTFAAPSDLPDIKPISGGLLVQDQDHGQIDVDQLSIVSKRQATDSELIDLMFAWRVAKYVKSNAIVYARDGRTIGIGAGQMSRVISAKIAGIKAQEANLDVPGSVMASDAFFPFRDGIDAAAAAGIVAVIQPGGSMRDQEVIDAADEHKMLMVFTGMRHFKH